MLAGISFDNCLVMAFTNTIINTFFTLFGGVVYLFYNNPREERKVNDKQS
jgi:hypothetical protein